MTTPPVEQKDSLERRLLALTAESEEDIAAYTTKLDEVQQGFHAFVRERRGKVVSELRRFFGVKEKPAFVAEALHEYLWAEKRQRYNANVALTDVIDMQRDQDPNTKVGNCLGLTALYAVLAMREGLTLSVMYVPPNGEKAAHIFPRVYVSDHRYDINATRADGFGNANSTNAKEERVEALLKYMGQHPGLRKKKRQRVMARWYALALLCGVPEEYVEKNKPEEMTEEKIEETIGRILNCNPETTRRETAKLIINLKGRYGTRFTGQKRELYRDIVHAVYHEFLDCIKAETGLKRFLVPQNGYEQLIQGCRGTMKWDEKEGGYEDREVQRVFIANLSLAYNNKEDTNPWRTAYERTSQELTRRIKEGRYAVTRRKQIMIDEAMNDLTEDEQLAVRESYGLERESGDGEPSKRPHNFVREAREKLTYDRRIGFIIENDTDAEIDVALREVEERKLSYRLTPIWALNKGRTHWNASSVLETNGVYTVEALIEKTEREVLAFDGIGKIRLKQLKERLKKEGYKLKE